MSNCNTCGRELICPECFDEDYTYCRSYCCGCCPAKDGYRGESCHKNYIDRQRGLPVGVIESLTMK